MKKRTFFLVASLISLMDLNAQQSYTGEITPNPRWPESYSIDIRPAWNSNTPRPILSPIDQMVEEERIANPMLQRGPEQSGSFDYDQLERRYPVRSVLPQNQRQTMTTEDAMAMDDYRRKRMADELAIKGAQLNQKIAQRDLEYKDKIITQAEEVQKLIGGLTPGSPTFDAQVADINLQYPLAQQNSAVQEQIQNLSQTNNQMKALLTKPLATGWLNSDHKISVDPSVQITLPKGTKITIWKISKNKTCEVSAGEIRFTCSVTEIAVDP